MFDPDRLPGNFWQAWALLEQEAGKLEEARQLFEAGSRADPHHLFIWQACVLAARHACSRTIIRCTFLTHALCRTCHASPAAGQHPLRQR